MVYDFLGCQEYVEILRKVFAEICVDKSHRKLLQKERQNRH